tara:strand:+ start:387 stop:839 length:453 start_codon:yes stop_codon:yes gene_type:complete
MKFTSEENCPAVYIRFKKNNYTVPTYVGETKNCFGGRPFRKNARGNDWQGTCKYKSIYILKCPEGRLLTREAYFVLHNLPIFQRKQLSRYFKKAWHLLKKEKVVELLRTMFVPERWSPTDWGYINNAIREIENEKQNYGPLVDKFIGNHF